MAAAFSQSVSVVKKNGFYLPHTNLNVFFQKNAIGCIYFCNRLYFLFSSIYHSRFQDQKLNKNDTFRDLAAKF
jgi:hypothetical protein